MQDTPTLSPPGSTASSEAANNQGEVYVEQRDVSDTEVQGNEEYHEEDNLYTNEMESGEVNLEELNPSSPKKLLKALERDQQIRDEDGQLLDAATIIPDLQRLIHERDDEFLRKLKVMKRSSHTDLSVDARSILMCDKTARFMVVLHPRYTNIH